MSRVEGLTKYFGIYTAESLGEEKFRKTRRKDGSEAKPYLHTAIRATRPTTQYYGIYTVSEVEEEKFRKTRRKDGSEVKP